LSHEPISIYTIQIVLVLLRFDLQPNIGECNPVVKRDPVVSKQMTRSSEFRAEKDGTFTGTASGTIDCESRVSTFKRYGWQISPLKVSLLCSI
jgi:hypothetical protein